MNINYAEIIEKANARKDALLAFEKAVDNLHAEMIEGVPDIISYCHEYRRTYKALDNEALELLPGRNFHAAHVLNCFAGTVTEPWDRMLVLMSSSHTVSPMAAVNILAGTPE